MNESEAKSIQRVIRRRSELTVKYVCQRRMIIYLSLGDDLSAAVRPSVQTQTQTLLLVFILALLSAEQPTSIILPVSEV
jgi:hypothetical protein